MVSRGVSLPEEILKEKGRRMKEEGRGKREDGGRKTEGKNKKEETFNKIFKGRMKKEEGRFLALSHLLGTLLLGSGQPLRSSWRKPWRSPSSIFWPGASPARSRKQSLPRKNAEAFDG